MPAAPLAELGERLAGPRARISSRVAAEEAAAATLAATGAQRWTTVTVTEATTETMRQEKRGRPGKNTRYRKIIKTHTPSRPRSTLRRSATTPPATAASR